MFAEEARLKTSVGVSGVDSFEARMMKKRAVIGMIVAMALGVQATHAGNGFQSFATKTDALTDLIKCPEGSAKVSVTAGLPDLWGCILPGAEVVKIFVNERDEDQVENIKLMWNDWTRDTGYGLHTDKAMAEAWLTAIATRYAPEQVDAVLSAFRGEEEAKIDSGAFLLTYRFDQGPAIAERLVTITEK